ncbi:putative membrane protein [metagenome]|uniref:Putative membrane protein n=1 Tax=metagenome TaxID=256318 RepID=A0A2P2BW83_9ZZZZ
MLTTVDSLALAFSSGWASGINSYLVVLVLGMADRLNDFDQIPDVLGRWEVLAVAGFLYAMEFVADKIPFIDSTWDAISTAIRPTVGAVIGVLLAGDATSLDQAISGVVGGGTALASHSVKMGSRLAINASPEPLSNIGASLAEDAAVLSVVWFAIEHPQAAAAIAGVLLAFGLVLLYFVAKLIRRGWRRWKGRVDPALS